jgi:small conductance mechanosensitive channel
MHPLPTPSTQAQIPGQQAAPSDTTGAAADSLAGSLDRLGQSVTETGTLVLQGEWEMVGQQIVRGTADWAVGFAPRLLSAVFVAAVFYVAYRILMGTTDRLLQRSRRVSEGLRAMGMKTLRVAALAFIAILVLSQLGVNVSALLAGLGIAGIAVGFAAKDSLENFISGVTILVDRPFRIGHWVEVAGKYGKVTDITLRSTRIKTLNRETVVFPNTEMVTHELVNHSEGGTLRIDVPFGIAYKEEVQAAREAVLGVVDDDDDRLDPQVEPRVVVTGLGASSVDMELHLFIRQAGEAVPLRFEFTEKIREALDEADIEIPFPHLQLFVDGAAAFDETPLRIVPAGDDGASSDPQTAEGEAEAEGETASEAEADDG